MVRLVKGAYWDSEIKQAQVLGDVDYPVFTKKSNTDYRKTGLVTIFTGVGLAAFDYYGLKTDIVFGVGLLVMFIGVGQMIAGYVYPNQADEINNAVESFEKK